MVLLLLLLDSIYKEKGDKYECSNSGGISSLSVVGKLYGRVLIKRVMAGTECAIGGVGWVVDAWTKCLT